MRASTQLHAMKILLVLSFFTVILCFPTEREKVPVAVETSAQIQSALAGSKPSTGFSVPTNVQNNPSSRPKREIIFRPLFVYRQEELRKERYREQKDYYKQLEKYRAWEEYQQSLQSNLV
ncbi:uncharacterized protein LOC129721843 [Wyeomyia smithii]|uniref:uncharacterized protein LOC129721843 n=1 Tax=Wyeomyia smithii TaxID=174621 RepID=UPI002468130B|nr:uncharacterized protein LOC129721843 [Wyeomyia smithii]